MIDAEKAKVISFNHTNQQKTLHLKLTAIGIQVEDCCKKGKYQTSKGVYVPHDLKDSFKANVESKGYRVIEGYPSAYGITLNVSWD